MKEEKQITEKRLINHTTRTNKEIEDCYVDLEELEEDKQKSEKRKKYINKRESSVIETSSRERKKMRTSRFSTDSILKRLM